MIYFPDVAQNPHYRPKYGMDKSLYFGNSKPGVQSTDGQFACPLEPGMIYPSHVNALAIDMYAWHLTSHGRLEFHMYQVQCTFLHMVMNFTTHTHTIMKILLPN